MVGKLLLFPNLLDPAQQVDAFLPKSVALAVEKISGLIAESEKSARAFLRRFLSHERMQRISLQLLNEHTKKEEITPLLAPLEKGEVWGLISDAGLPSIADPGQALVQLAHRKGISIETFSGPSSLIFALQLSGFSGQSFAFHGYLPKEEIALEKKIKELERNALGTTQIWIEAPYRTEKMVRVCLGLLKMDTEFCVAANLGVPEQKLLSAPILVWKKKPLSLKKEPAVFLLYRKKNP